MPPPARVFEDRLSSDVPLLQPCRDFLHNRCYKGDRCIYSHDIDHIRLVNKPQDGLCMSFIFGVCELPLCRFKHDVTAVQELLEVITLGCHSFIIRPVIFRHIRSSRICLRITHL
uniref:C3H1-type domain-containing protein n=1 Tax=Ulva partita TaxID=1605170 RepID=A0A1C9ZPV6_9CHLO|nr:hypothetical protein [Ulva partita]